MQLIYAVNNTILSTIQLLMSNLFTQVTGPSSILYQQSQVFVDKIFYYVNQFTLSTDVNLISILIIFLTENFYKQKLFYIF